jgi:hypothetical protein
MVVALSYVFAVILTAALAIVLYPIAAIFWIMGLFGRLAEGMFSFTQSVIKTLWKDLGNAKRTAPVTPEVNPTMIGQSVPAWVCSCGAANDGRFCTACGKTLDDNGLWMCECGAVNKAKFCNKCGTKREGG